MAKKKFYAIKKGRKPGIYRTWDEAKQQVDGFPGAIYKSFSTESEAEQWQDGRDSISKAVPQSDGKADGLVLYTDGGSRNTGNVAGGHVRKEDLAAWAFMIKKGSLQLSDSGGEFGATNNRMEIMALINGLKMVIQRFGDQEPILVVSDSKYVLDAINQNWIWGWKRRNWKKANGEIVANKELWQEVALLLGRIKHVEFKWTKGHADNTGNVFVDELLNQTMDQMTSTKQVPKSKTTTNVQKKIVQNKEAASNPETEKSVQDLMTSFKQLGLFKDPND
ncbi:ribonuclease H family protein [Pediococcus stilesii]|uniref:Ribonuclease H n=1 Tax=Pediococcus stilesii TaxID=331679 RepID=A0A0R2KX10_9LACO|nr:ribonuclease H family protein [Pediococcus stilesii]KRN93969.1 RNase HI [Pediococcus stilesii]